MSVRFNIIMGPGFVKGLNLHTVFKMCPSKNVFEFEECIFSWLLFVHNNPSLYRNLSVLLLLGFGFGKRNKPIRGMAPRSLFINGNT